jgi:steroid delta-isomerase-like uncharacterized protein
MTALDVFTLWQDAFRRRDLNALADLYSETAVMESPMAGGTVMGREAIISAQEGLFASFPNMVPTFEAPLIDEDRLGFVVEVAGTHAGLLMGLPPTGRPFRFNLVFLFDLRDGRIVRDRRIYDFTGLLIQVGVLKAKPA